MEHDGICEAHIASLHAVMHGVTRRLLNPHRPSFAMQRSGPVTRFHRADLRVFNGRAMNTQLWYLIIGVLLVVAVSGTMLKRLPLTPTMVYFGMARCLGGWASACSRSILCAVRRCWSMRWRWR